MKSVGEGFQAPVDLFTGQRIVGAPLIARPSNMARSTGTVMIESNFQNTRPSGFPTTQPTIDQPYVGGDPVRR